ncbi:amino acid racemase [uncultured Psychrobacter sp.]|uniref:aspartate/glutamate racemase family protein n=1 Tax=Psychrobacter pacificensis TaxID=112002 RepID=UPI00214FDDA8|nr:amino acid racemase [Psychrobacter sp. AntiMn-1]
MALLDTQFTMTQGFYKQRLIDAGLKVLIPAEDERAEVHRIIKKELCVGKFKDSSREYYIDVITKLAEQGAEGVILGCTEVGLLITQDDSLIPVFDTTVIHAAAAVRFLVDKDFT